MQDIRAHLNDHIEASVDEHLEMTWSSLVATKQELDSMKDLRQKFQKVQESNQKLAEAVTDCREEIRDLTLTVKNLEMKNIQQEKQMEGLGRKIKSVESEKLQLTNSWDSEKKIRRLKYQDEVSDVSRTNISRRHARERVLVSYFTSEGNSSVDNIFD